MLRGVNAGNVGRPLDIYLTVGYDKYPWRYYNCAH